MFEVSELRDGDRGRGRTKGDIGECDMPLLHDIFLGLENVEPAVELA